MKTYKKTVSEGEKLGPIDWNYDFEQYSWDRGGSTNPKSISNCVKRLRQIEEILKNGRSIEATTDGGWPRCGWAEVLDIGMWDGWPYWAPVPSFCLSGQFWGAQWHSFLMLSDIRQVNSKKGVR